MTEPPPRIVADVPEERSGIPGVLVEELGADVEVAALPAGDYAVGVHTLVEREGICGLRRGQPEGVCEAVGTSSRGTARPQHVLELCGDGYACDARRRVYPIGP